MMEGILQLKNVTKRFGGLKAVDGVSFNLTKGIITSLIGPNGAGKTTIFNLISGFIRPDNGSIYYNGTRIDNLSPWEIAELGVGRLFQEVRVFNRLTVLENVLLARKRQPGENPLASLFLRNRSLGFEEKNLEGAKKWIEFVGLKQKANSLAEDLSYGQQKLLAIARLLAGNSDLLLLDEPTAGVHPVMAKSILKVIRDLVNEGKTAIVIEHNMRVVADISDWIYLLNEGKIVTFGKPQEVLDDPVLKEVYLGV